MTERSKLSDSATGAGSTTGPSATAATLTTSSRGASSPNRPELTAVLCSTFLLLLLAVVVGLSCLTPTWLTSLVIGALVLGFGFLLVLLRHSDHADWLDWRAAWASARALGSNAASSTARRLSAPPLETSRS